MSEFDIAAALEDFGADESLAANQAAGEKLAAYDEIRVPYRPQIAAFLHLDRFRQAAAQRVPGVPCGAAVLVEPFGAGKTYSIELLVRHAHQSMGAVPGQHPVLHVTMDSDGSADTVPTSILTALDRPRPYAGNVKARWKRAIDAMQEAGVQLIVFDEFNHADRRPTMKKAIGEAIRQHIMDSGLAAVALVGTVEAKSVLKACPALGKRVRAEIELSLLDWLRPDDPEMLKGFLKAFDSKLVEKAVLPSLSGLDNDKVAKGICEASQGELRTIVNLLRTATNNVLLREGRAITNEDLFVGADLHGVRQDLIDVNPFA